LVTEAAMRAHLVKLPAWEDAHVGFETAVKAIPARLRGAVPDGWEYSAWQLVEHIRIEADILEFCRSANVPREENVLRGFEKRLYQELR